MPYTIPFPSLIFSTVFHGLKALSTSVGGWTPTYNYYPDNLPNSNELILLFFNTAHFKPNSPLLTHKPSLVKFLLLVKWIAIYLIAKRETWESPSVFLLSFPPSPLTGLFQERTSDESFLKSSFFLLGYCWRWLHGSCGSALFTSSFQDPFWRDMSFYGTGEKTTWLKFAMALNVSAWSQSTSLPLGSFSKSKSYAKVWCSNWGVHSFFRGTLKVTGQGLGMKNSLNRWRSEEPCLIM